MDGCVYPYRHVAPADASVPTRSALGIAQDAVVLGAFVTGMKLSRRCLALWRDELLPRASRAPAMTGLAFEQGLVDDGARPAVVQRLAAVGSARPWPPRAG